MDNSDYNVGVSVMNSIRRYIDSKYGDGVFDIKCKTYFPGYAEEKPDNISYPLKSLVNCLLDLSIEKESGFREYIVGMYKDIIISDLTSVNKSFIKSAGIRKTLRSSPQLIKNYFNVQEMNIIENSVGYCMYDLISDDYASEWHLYGHEGIIQAILGICGNKMSEFKIHSKITFLKNKMTFTKVNIELLYS